MLEVLLVDLHETPFVPFEDRRLHLEALLVKIVFQRLDGLLVRLITDQINPPHLVPPRGWGLPGRRRGGELFQHEMFQLLDAAAEQLGALHPDRAFLQLAPDAVPFGAQVRRGFGEVDDLGGQGADGGSHRPDQGRLAGLEDLVDFVGQVVDFRQPSDLIKGGDTTNTSVLTCGSSCRTRSSTPTLPGGFG